MPHCFKMQHKPRAISHKSSTQQIKHKKQPKTAPQAWACSHNLEHQKMNKMHQRKAKNSRIEYLLEWVETTKMKAKRNQKWLRGAKTASLRESTLLNEGGEVFGYKNVPLPRLYFECRGCSPRRANLPIFFFKGALTTSPLSYGLAFCLTWAYLS